MFDEIRQRLGLGAENSGAGTGRLWRKSRGKPMAVRSPIDGRTVASVQTADAEDIEAVIDAACEAFKVWRGVPAPVRGEFVRRIGNRLRERKADLAALVSWE